MGGGDALEQAWRLYREEWRRVVAVSALAYAAIVLLTAVFFVTLGLVGLAAAAYLWFAGLYWLQAPLTRIVDDRRAGVPWRGPRAALASIYPQLGRVTGGSAIVALVVAPLLATIVLAPLALYFMARWSLLVPVIAAEDRGLFAAFSRAREIARGHVGHLFGRIALSALLLVSIWIGIGIAAALLALLDDSPLVTGLGFAVIAIVALILTTPLIALAWTMTYYDLRAQVPAEVLNERRLSGGVTLDRAWTAYTRRYGRLALLCLPGAALTTALQAAIGQVNALLAFPLTVALYVALAGVVAAGLEGMDHRPVGEWLRATARRAAPRLPQLVVMTVLLTLALAVSIPLVIGLVLLVRWSVAGPIVVMDGAGPLRALRRSSDLVRGHTRRAAKVVFVSGVVLIATLAAFALLAPTDFPFATYALLALANVVAAPYVALAWAFMHRTLIGLRPAEPPPTVA